MNEVEHADGQSFAIRGDYDERFRPVVEAFKENYRLGEELGSSVSVMIDGQPVVDIWGGYRDRAMTQVWDRDTTVCMMSVAKGVTAIAFNMLLDRGLVDLDEPSSSPRR